jgi:hypothetical protein
MTSILKFYKDLEKYGLIKDSQFILNIPLELLSEIFDDVKYLHKQEIIDAYNKSFELRDKPYSTADKYYQETFVSKGSDDHISDISKMVEVPQQENLYTEEQVREAIEIAFKHWLHYSSCNVEEIIKSLKQPKKD